MTLPSECLEVKPKKGDIVLIQDMYSTFSGNRTTLIDKLVNVMEVNLQGKIFYDRIIGQVQTHLVLNDYVKEGAKEKHIEKLKTMLITNNIDYDKIYKIITDDRKLEFQ